jgi:16S rRNA C967 or C1407 C5-methylase (RsmB/RsmF family)/NOL1/NOP2/fmu family ribosome biogenesis protein
MESQLSQDEWQTFLQALQAAPPVCIRLNPNKPTNASRTESIPWCSTGYYLPERPSFTLDPVFHAGAYYVQEASSMFLEQVVKQTLDLNQSLKVLDLCAAPGGKSTHLLSLINTESLLISNEVIRARTNILCESIQKWGNANVVITQHDPSHFKDLAGYFDLIVVDAPCSGEGLFRKEPDSISEWSPANVELCSQRQKRILADVFPALKQNGILIYSTCTFNKQENECNLKWLADQHDIEFLKIDCRSDWGVYESSMEGAIGYRFYPHRAKGEGFFITAIRKLGFETPIKLQANQPFKVLKETGQLNSWIMDSGHYHFIMNKEEVRLIPRQYIKDIEFMATHFGIVAAGTAVGSFKHDKLIPDHALALSTKLDHNQLATFELSKEEALAYLRKDNLTIATERTGLGLVTHSKLALGWVNVLKNRVNNLYPMNWRIRNK